MIDFINTGGAKQLQDSRFTDIMPENLSGQIETQAFAYALARQVEKLCVFADRATLSYLASRRARARSSQSLPSTKRETMKETT